MSKRLTLLAALTLLSATTYGQATLHKKSLLSLSIVPLAPSLETPLSKRSSFFIQAGLGPLLLFENGSSDTPPFSMAGRPFARAQYRLYSYSNLRNREIEEKNTAFNSGSFVGLMVQYTPSIVWGNPSDLFTERSGWAMGPMWGMQRNTKKFTFSFSIGAGLYVYKSTYAAHTVNGQVTQLGTDEGKVFNVFGALNMGVPLAGFN